MTPAEIKQARKTLGLTQTEAARVLGYGQQVRISEIEHGAVTPGGAVTRLLQAYINGYRPDDWPLDRRKKRA